MTTDEMFELKPLLEAEALKNKRARRLERMHLLYGRCEDKQCGDCRHFVSHSLAHTYHKCLLFGVTRGPATDWRVRYVACGRFEAKPDEKGAD